MGLGSVPWVFLAVSGMMGWALSHPAQFPPYKGEGRYGHQGWWNGADYPFACPRDGVNPSWTVGKKLCGGVHYRYYIEGHGYVGGYGEGNDPCRANPWNRYSAWVCK